MNQIHNYQGIKSKNIKHSIPIKRPSLAPLRCFSSFLAMLVFITPPLAQTEEIFSPHTCSQWSDLSLQIKNDSNLESSFWLRNMDTVYEERSFVLGPHEHMEIPVGKIFPTPRPINLARTHSLIQAHWKCKDRDYHLLVPISGTTQKFSLNSGAQKFLYMNLFPQKHELLISYLDKNGNRILTEKIETGDYYQSAIYQIKKIKNARELFVESNNRWQGRILNSLSNNEQFGQSIKTKFPNLQPNERLYEISDDEHSQSFLLKLSDPDQIKTAREILATGKFKLVIAEISLSKNSQNFDLSHPNNIQWSWEITKFKGFADIGSVACNGSPSMVESLIFYLKHPTNICFWSYHLIRELP